MEDFALLDYLNKKRLSYFKDIFSHGRKLMHECSMTESDISAYKRHIPTRENEGWSEEIYDMSEKFLEELTEYQKTNFTIRRPNTAEQEEKHKKKEALNEAVSSDGGNNSGNDDEPVTE